MNVVAYITDDKRVKELPDEFDLRWDAETIASRFGPLGYVNEDYIFPTTYGDCERDGDIQEEDGLTFYDEDGKIVDHITVDELKDEWMAQNEDKFVFGSDPRDQ